LASCAIIVCKMKYIFVCSEFGGSEENLVLARKYCRYVLDESPGNNFYAPHLILPQILDESDPDDRARGIASGLRWFLKCDQMWVFVKNGVLSAGMVTEIKNAIASGVPIFYFDATDTITELRHLRSDVLPSKADLLSSKTFATTAKTNLDAVAEALKAGAKYEDLQAQMESFLGGVDTTETDPEADQVWEENYRAGR